MLEKHFWNTIWLYLVVEIWQLVHEKTQQTFVGLLEDVFKTCLESWRRLQNVFNVTISRLPRRLEDVLQICLEDVLKTSWKTKNCCAEDILKTSWRHVLNTSSRRPGDKENNYREYLYLANLNLYLTNLYLTYLHLTNQGESKMHLLVPNNFNILLILKLKQHFYFEN